MDGKIYNANEKRKKQGLEPVKNPYYVIYRVPDSRTGQMKQTTKRGFRTKDEAQKFLMDIQMKISNNTYIQPSEVTIEQYLTDWVEAYVEPNLKQATIDGYKVNIFKHIIPRIGKIKLNKLTVMDIEKMYSVLIKEGRLDGKGGLSGKSIMYVHRNLRMALNHAVKKKLIQFNPAQDVILPKVSKYFAEVLSHEEITKLLKGLLGTEIETPVALGALAGMRRGECLGLKWSDINFKEKTIYVKRQLIVTTKGIHFEEPKTVDSIRKIMITDYLMQVLIRQKKRYDSCKSSFSEKNLEYDAVSFQSDGGLISPHQLNKRFVRALKKCGLKHIRFHDLRHSYATYMLQFNVPVNVVSKMLGHKSVAITMEVYAHVIDEMQKAAIDKQNSMFSALMSKVPEITSGETQKYVVDEEEHNSKLKESTNLYLAS